MAYTLLPGYRQNHRGQTYQLARYPNGKLIEVKVDEPSLSAASAAALEQVLVESKSRLQLNHDKPEGEPRNLEWVETALTRGSLHAQGETYESLACYQGASA